jgi:anti-sigma-K factor RskA
MSDLYPDDIPPEDWLLAAEYALGLQDGAERLALERRARRDRSFALNVSAWEMRFAALHADAADASPPDALKARIDEELFGAARAAPRSQTRRSTLAGAISFWRAAALAFAAVSLVCLALLARPLFSPAPAAPLRLIAALAPADAATLAFVSIDAAAHRLDVSGLSVDPGAGDAELWVIPPGGAPRSIGLLERGAATTKSIGPDLIALLVEGAALAISLEPKGGSPTGAPTGPVVALGPLKRF